MKLKKNKWEKVLLGEVVDELRNTSRQPLSDGYQKYVGFEHIEPGTLKITHFGNLADGVSFTKTFEKDDVLFGKIRAYLRKVGVAPISGICSGDILVLRTKNEKKISQKFLPYYIISESFIKRAINTSIGTTLPRTKWQHLSKHEILIPSLEEQKQFAKLFQTLQTATEDIEVQEAQVRQLAMKIIEDLTNEKPFLGNVIDESKVTNVQLGDIAYDYSRREDNPRESVFDRYVGSDSIGRFDFKVYNWQSSKEIVSSMKIFEPNDYLLVRRSLYASDFRERAPRADFSGLCSGDILTIRENDSLISDGYLLIILNCRRLWEHVVANASGSITRRVKWRELSSFVVPLPERKTQKKIAEIFKQIQVILDQLSEQKRKLRELKQSLLHEIFD